MEHRHRVLVADGEDASREGLAEVLSSGGFRVLEAATGVEAMEMARRQEPAAVVLEIPLAGLSGYEVCRALKAEMGTDLPVVFVTGARVESYDRVAGLLLGADDYIVKPFAADELLARVRNLITRASLTERRGTVGGGLTPREQEILELLSDALTPSEIARGLFISPKTVATHVENLCRKLGVRGRAELVALAYREELVRPRRVAER